MMILWGTFASQVEPAQPCFRSNWRVWVLNCSGVVLTLYVFMADSLAAAQSRLGSIRTMLPEKFGWPMFCLVLALMCVVMDNER
jgi:hypothetical protein